MRAKLLLLIVLLGTASAQAVPRFFAEAEGSPPTAEAVLFRTGIQLDRWRLFAGYFNVHGDADADSPGWYTPGDSRFLLGAQWFTTGNTRAVVVPKLGGGIEIGKYKSEYYSWTYDYSQHPSRLYLESRPIDEPVTVGLIADTGLNFRVVRDKLTLSTNIFWNFAVSRRSSTMSYEYDYEPVDNKYARLSAFLMLGASYQF